MKLIVAACNSATAAALPDLQRQLSVPVIGVLAPEAHAAVLATRNRRIGLLATEATVESGRYVELVRALDAGAEVCPVACPRLVPLIEADEVFGEEIDGRGPQIRRPVQGGRRRHRHPRLHALPADPPDPAARLRSRRHARLLRGGDGARGGRDARAEGDRERRRPRGHVPLPHDRRSRSSSARWAADSCSFRSRGPSTSRSRRSRPSHEARRPASRSAPRARHRSRTTSSSRTARCSTRRARRSCSARRRSRRAFRAGSPSPAAAG